jgi:hypothetical protein
MPDYADSRLRDPDRVPSDEDRVALPDDVPPPGDPIEVADRDRSAVPDRDTPWDPVSPDAEARDDAEAGYHENLTDADAERRDREVEEGEDDVAALDDVEEGQHDVAARDDVEGGYHDNLAPDDVEAGQQDVDAGQPDFEAEQQRDFEAGQPDIEAGPHDFEAEQHDVAAEQQDVAAEQHDVAAGQQDVAERDGAVGRAEAELAAAEERGDEPHEADVERAEAELAAAEAGLGRGIGAGEAVPQPAQPEPVAPEPVVATSLPLQGDGVAVGTYEGPTVRVPTESGTEAPTELKPGEADTAPVGALWDDDARRDLRDRWREVQLRFVDDPTATVTEAQSLVDDALDRYTQSLTTMRSSLDSWRTGPSEDTEVLRAALRRYRDFFDTLLK